MAARLGLQQAVNWDHSYATGTETGAPASAEDHPTAPGPTDNPQDEPIATTATATIQPTQNYDPVEHRIENDIYIETLRHHVESPVTLVGGHHHFEVENLLARDGDATSRGCLHRCVPEVNGIDLTLPGYMIALFFVGVFFSVGHHLYHTSLIGRTVGGNWEQLSIRGLSNLFSYLVQLAFLGSIGIAYTQTLWMNLRERAVTPGCLDAAFGARSNWFFIFHKEMFRELPIGASIALALWCIPIPLSIIPPATLITDTRNVTNSVIQAVPSLGISDPNWSHFFQLSRPSNGPDSPNNESLMFLGPRTILSRLSVAAAATGQMLSITPPFNNCTYELAFYGPIVQCETANETVSTIIDYVVNRTMVTENNITAVYNAYYAYVPDLSTIGDPRKQVSRTQFPLQSSNELWFAYKRNGTGYTSYPYPTCPNTEHRVCRLYNASYELQFTYVDGIQQSISGYPPTILEPIEYPTLNLNGPSDTVQFAYSAFFWALTDQLVGSMGFFNESITNSAIAQWSNIDSTIENTALLGSSDLDCFFFEDILFNPDPNAPTSPQRSQDIKLAKNLTLDVLIPELAFNTTISLMNDLLLGPSVNEAVIVTNNISIFDYHSRNLVLCYSFVGLVALVANCVGAYAFQKNGASHDWSFWSIFSATDKTGLPPNFHGRRGSLPIPKALQQLKLKLKWLGHEGGGWGFRWSRTSDTFDSLDDHED